MPISNIAFGTPREASHPDALRAALAEFISMLIFVFAGSGSGMAFNKLTDSASTTPSGLIAAALAHAFALFVAVSVGANISGGHVNPAVTFGALLGGNITLLRSILYWIAQLLGSVVACFLLKFATGGLETPAFGLSSGVGAWNALVFEIVMTFGLVYTVYATAVDPKKGNLGVIAPIAIGFIVGANILAGGAFDGASMNPAVSFGPAVVSGVWTNHWVYWLGPFIGAAIAALVYDNIFIGSGASTSKLCLLFCFEDTSNFTSKSHLAMLELVSSMVATLPRDLFQIFSLQALILQIFVALRMGFESFKPALVPLRSTNASCAIQQSNGWTSLHLVCHSRGSKERKFGHNCTYCKGFIVGANILAIDASDGAPVSFGPAAASWNRGLHWFYWPGPSIRAAIAALVRLHLYWQWWTE
ncbi:hypothetical protein OIU78_005594 [Salix suchowensis]|nr:hypothetical protein OIU78_005594 [Salix suchowensis]